MNPYVLIVIIIFLAIQNAFKIMMHEFEGLDLALNLHFAGLALSLPLPMTDLRILTLASYSTIIEASFLLITGACYMICRMNPHKTFYKKIGLLNGCLSFIIGITVSMI